MFFLESVAHYQRATPEIHIFGLCRSKYTSLAPKPMMPSSWPVLGLIHNTSQSRYKSESMKLTGASASRARAPVGTQRVGRSVDGVGRRRSP